MLRTSPLPGAFQLRLDKGDSWVATVFSNHQLLTSRKCSFFKSPASSVSVLPSGDQLLPPFPLLHIQIQVSTNSSLATSPKTSKPRLRPFPVNPWSQVSENTMLPSSALKLRSHSNHLWGNGPLTISLCNPSSSWIWWEQRPTLSPWPYTLPCPGIHVGMLPWPQSQVVTLESQACDDHAVTAQQHLGVGEIIQPVAETSQSSGGNCPTSHPIGEIGLEKNSYKILWIVDSYFIGYFQVI